MLVCIWNKWHFGFHLRVVVFFSFFIETLDVKIQYQTYDNDILESCGNEMLTAVLLSSVWRAGQSDLSQQHEELRWAFREGPEGAE